MMGVWGWSESSVVISGALNADFEVKKGSAKISYINLFVTHS